MCRTYTFFWNKYHDRIDTEALLSMINSKLACHVWVEPLALMEDEYAAMFLNLMSQVLDW
jgi:hypothetical protein